MWELCMACGQNWSSETEKHGRVAIVLHGSFVIDKDLGLLTDNGNLRSRLFKLYLHALTSPCLPDPLIFRTGSEEALHGLRLAAGTKSFLDMEQSSLHRPTMLFTTKREILSPTVLGSLVPATLQHW
ncbi:uncharacterized protein L3040_001185 [Drepanopeziza brunnea f. sp. 'multigermtubi']|uniref:uncharacterized protein n=1 Tax=Drepanopeziza brunnea f. sp. 'multigermtubi' TaxID=698441 RepID=UPI00239517B6|nr:hypothetical protein L3040_001185 [Drepanopeziza brunnea f. sp. 'multigermtubi']